ncbi:hypothetical protein HMPREF9943_00024 [Eggerthia catenaformis OT 569 = DSM 20559]|uniref:FeoB-associated Cys-rich membrane protein n=1 Tax=Eggerthia catenaformis OT 569 = DSM 20559 TaxID=999415 RepID=M2PB50_9FIRM|nr:FeoB-associated Cys-rich membrane protein [Eggerthia catenaformis]EMD17592.1 hypothetical protein HMPREF9943_00024 [Eggerthia catenaformis OT 569 = DSM 20559]
MWTYIILTAIIIYVIRILYRSVHGKITGGCDSGSCGSCGSSSICHLDLYDEYKKNKQAHLSK